MLAWVGDVAVRRKWLVLALGLLFVAVAGVVGGGVAGRLGGGGFSDPEAESSRSAALMEATFDTGDPNLVLLVTAASGDVDDPAVAEAGMALTDELAAEAGRRAKWSPTGAWAALRRCAARTDAGPGAGPRSPGDEEAVAGRHRGARRLAYTRADGPITVAVGGYAEVFRRDHRDGRGGSGRAETIALPITLVLLVLVFGSVVAAGLPLVVGGHRHRRHLPRCSRVITEVTDVSIFALNLTTAMGLGLGDRLQPLHRLPLPRGAAAGLDHRARRCVRTVGPRGAPSPSAP